MNTGVPPRAGLVPFGQPGWCFIPTKLRQRRNAPKYERAEPVLMVGYQHMYTTVYRCLTRHNTIVHSEQVFWDMKAPLGVFLSPKTVASRSKQERPQKLKLKDVDLFAEKQKSKPAAPANKKASSMPSGTLRLNKSKVFDPSGNPRVQKPYILERVKAVDGLTVEEACKLEFPDAHGKLKPYHRDIHYDVFEREWLRIESSSESAPRAAAAAATVTPATALPQEAKSEPIERFSSFPENATEETKQKCFFSSVYGVKPEHPDGMFGAHMTRHHRRAVRRAVLSAYRRRRRWLHRTEIVQPRAARSRQRHSIRLKRLSQEAERSCAESSDADATAKRVFPEELSNLSDDDIRHACNIAMRDLPWRPYLHGKEVRHKEDVLKAYRAELDSLTSTVLREIKEGDKEWEAARTNNTTCRALLEWKRQGLWKVRVVIQGHKENRVALDGPDFQYASDVVGLTAIRALFLSPLKAGEVIGQCDISTAFLQSDLFPEDAPPRYLMLPDPVTGTNRYFRQLGVVYGSASSSKRWQDTLHNWLVMPEADGGGGYEQGANDPCLFYHPRLKATLATYVDDLAIKAERKNAEEAFAAVRARFKCKDVHWLTRENALDHLGMTFFQDAEGTYLSMANYIEAMVVRLGINVDVGRRVKLPMSGPITDYTPLSKTDAKWFMSATGMLGWLAGTGRCDVKLCHSRIAAYMANPCVGALKAAVQAVKYCAHNKHLCLFQPFDGPATWVHFSDSDHAGNPEPAAKRKSQLGYVSMCGTAPIGWGSKASSVNFDDRLASIAESCNPSRNNPKGKRIWAPEPTCHSRLKELHPDMSSGAAEIYAASVTLTEVMHLSYLMEEMGHEMTLPYTIRVDNTAAIAFSKGNVRRSKLKHIDVRQQWVQYLRDKKLCRLEYVNTKENLADFYTKILDTDTFERLRGQMMVERPLPAAAAA